jgi:hypothetical protein
MSRGLHEGVGHGHVLEIVDQGMQGDDGAYLALERG